MEILNFHLSVFVLIFTCLGCCCLNIPQGTTKITSIKELLSHEKASLLTTCEDEHRENVSLDLSYLGLRRIKEEFISNPHVTCLNLEGNEIEEVNLNAFKGLSNLTYLNLANNKFDVVDFLSYGLHPNLKTLILDNVEPQQTQPIHYYNTGIKNIQISVGLPNLEYLYLRNISKGRISSFSIANLPKLTHLYLSGNNFENEINTFLENIPPALSHLYIEKCNILLNQISNPSTSLISLSLDGNAFSCLDDGCMDFRNFPRLKFLSIANSSINFDLLSAFQFNSDLLYLDVSQNLIQELPEDLFNKLSNLEVLNLNSNQLSMIPNLCSLKKLRKLYVSFNNIKHVYRNSFSCVDGLQSLSLSGNFIDSISAGTFDNLRNLVELNLSHNKLSKLEYRTSLNLKYLFLNDNWFKSVDYVLLGNNSLVSLTLHNNPIGTLKPLSLKFLPENTTIYMKNGFPELEKEKLFDKGFFSQTLHNYV